MFIVIEGADAVGKNTQTHRLVDRLKKNLPPPSEVFGSKPMEIQLISFPRYITPVGQAILRHLKGETALMQIQLPKEYGKIDFTIPYRSTDDALAFQALMLFDKYQAASAIKSHLDHGGIVVSDRYWPSACAYGGAEGFDEETLFEIHAMLPKPDLAILLDLDPTIAAARRGAPRDRNERDQEKMKAVRERYRKLWQSGDRRVAERLVIVDSNQPADVVENQIWNFVAPIFFPF